MKTLVANVLNSKQGGNRVGCDRQNWGNSVRTVINFCQRLPVMKYISALAICGLYASSPAYAAERAQADISCAKTAEKLVYDCKIQLMTRKSETPISHAKVVIKAEMPAMPMAHNVAPITAIPIGKPGSYHARIKLEMHGEWALILDVNGPLRDRLVKKLQFGEMGAMKHGDGEMKHSETMPKSE
jgi:hypothetical protein